MKRISSTFAVTLFHNPSGNSARYLIPRKPSLNLSFALNYYKSNAQQMFSLTCKLTIFKVKSKIQTSTGHQLRNLIHTINIKPILRVKFP